jgi:hypothetical protein
MGEDTATNLAAGGHPQPSGVISKGIFGVGLAFDPHWTALPLH